MKRDGTHWGGTLAVIPNIISPPKFAVRQSYENFDDGAKYNRGCSFMISANSKLPRILVIIDEFQKLFDGDINTNFFISKVIDDIGRRGRSFGINLILSTQSLGNVDIKSSFGNFGLRIALKLNTTKDCHHLFGENNFSPHYDLTRKGEAIYNSNGGNSSSNIYFQTALLNDSKLALFISRIKNYENEKYKTNLPFKRFIYDGSVHANINRNPEYMDSFIKKDKVCTVYVGEPIALEEKHIQYSIGYKNGANILIVGQDINSAIAIIYYSLLQIIRQSQVNSRFYLFNTISESNKKLNSLKESYSNLTILEDNLKLESILSEVLSEIEKRRSTNIYSDRIILFFSDIYNLTSFQKISYKSSTSTEKLKTILKDGPRVGIHTIIHACSYSNFNTIFEHSINILSEFETKIQLRGEDSYKIFGPANFEAQKATPTKDFTANIKTVHESKIQKLKVYSI